MDICSSPFPWRSYWEAALCKAIQGCWWHFQGKDGRAWVALGAIWMAFLSFLVSSCSQVCGDNSKGRDPWEVLTPSTYENTMWNIFQRMTDHQSKLQCRKMYRSPKELGEVCEGSPEITFVHKIVRNPLLSAWKYVDLFTSFVIFL